MLYMCCFIARTAQFLVQLAHRVLFKGSRTQPREAHRHLP